jgi:LPXTG-site transpeptidase (sortase) family protein
MLFSDAVLPDISGSPVEMAAAAAVPTLAEIHEPHLAQPIQRRYFPWLLISLAVVAAMSIPVVLLFARPGKAKPGDAFARDQSQPAGNRTQAVSLASSPPATSATVASSHAVAQNHTEDAHTEQDQPTPKPGAFVLPNSASMAESTPTQIPSLTPSRQPNPTPSRESRPIYTPIPSATPTLEPKATVTPTIAPVRPAGQEPEPTGTSRPTRGLVASDPRSAYPSRLVIPAIDLDAPIKRVGYTNVLIDGQRAVTWAVPNSFAAGWHHTSAPLGQPGNTVLNGHESVGGGVFRDIVQLRPDDEIIVYAGSAAYRFRVSERHTLSEEGQPIEVRSSNARWIMPTGDERLTLVTCAPHAESTHRLIIVALPTE